MLLFCFLLPLLGAVRFNLLGEMTLAEPILILYWLFSLRKTGELMRIPIARRIMTLGLLWLLALIAADIYRGTSSQDYLRGWSKTALLLVSYSVSASLVGTDLRRAGAMIAGMMLMPVLNYWMYPSEYAFYKFFLGYAVSGAAFWLAMLFGGERRPLAVVFPILAGCIAVFLDCRSLGGITLSAAAYYTLLSMKLLSNEKSWRSRVIFGVFWLLLSFSVVQLYSTLAASGQLSNTAQDKYEAQLNDVGQFSVLGGRNEAYFSVPKIVQSPLIGWGSWVKDVEYVAGRAAELGMNSEQTVASTGGLIPAHSHLLGAWLEAGVFGGVFWLYVLYLIGRIFASGWLRGTLKWSGILSFVLILFTWDIFFSPFGGERRFADGLYLWLVTMIVLVSKERLRRPTHNVSNPLMRPALASRGTNWS